MNTPTVLLVEDDVLLSSVIEKELEDAGFGLILAHAGAWAIAQLETRTDEIACLLTDIRLGSGIDGWELARQARLLKPTLPVVYMSADSGQQWAAQGVPGSIMLNKPFALAQLRTAVAGLMNEAPTN